MELWTTVVLQSTSRVQRTQPPYKSEPGGPRRKYHNNTNLDNVQTPTTHLSEERLALSVFFLPWKEKFGGAQTTILLQVLYFHYFFSQYAVRAETIQKVLLWVNASISWGRCKAGRGEGGGETYKLNFNVSVLMFKRMVLTYLLFHWCSDVAYSELHHTTRKNIIISVFIQLRKVGCRLRSQKHILLQLPFLYKYVTLQYSVKSRFVGKALSCIHTETNWREYVSGGEEGETKKPDPTARAPVNLCVTVLYPTFNWCSVVTHSMLYRRCIGSPILSVLFLLRKGSLRLGAQKSVSFYLLPFYYLFFYHAIRCKNIKKNLLLIQAGTDWVGEVAGRGERKREAEKLGLNVHTLTATSTTPARPGPIGCLLDKYNMVYHASLLFNLPTSSRYNGAKSYINILKYKHKQQCLKYH